MLATMTGARRILEIGMFTGYSTLAWAEALPKDGHIVTCDCNPETTEIAKRYFAESPHGPKIEIKFGPALKSLKTIWVLSISVSSTPTRRIIALTTTSVYSWCGRAA